MVSCIEHVERTMTQINIGRAKVFPCFRLVCFTATFSFCCSTYVNKVEPMVDSFIFLFGTAFSFFLSVCIFLCWSANSLTNTIKTTFHHYRFSSFSFVLCLVLSLLQLFLLSVYPPRTAKNI